MGRIPKIMSSADECRQACIDLKDCFGFTFVKSDKTRHNCAVKKEWRHESKTRSTCCDSGQVTNACRKGNVAWIELRSFKGKFMFLKDSRALYIIIIYTRRVNINPDVST